MNVKNDSKKKFDLEDRLIVFALKIIDIVEQLPNNRVGNHIAGQLVRCGTSSAFNYAEAQSAESKNDFIHKLKICLKELRETNVCMKLINRKPLIENMDFLNNTIKENNELISIFVKSIETARSRK